MFDGAYFLKKGKVAVGCGDVVEEFMKSSHVSKLVIRVVL